MSSSATYRYWMHGEEVCAHCHFRYAFAIERRCAVCDGPACPDCVTTVSATREVRCRPCTSETPDHDAEE